MKHFVLREYLRAWLPILASGHRRLLFVDGFAGPGIYEGGEPGSPIVAAEVARDHDAPQLRGTKIVMVFIERCPDRFASLRRQLERFRHDERLVVEPIHGTFEDEFGGALDRFDAQGERLAPAFVMIDPFGWTGFPMSLVERIGAHDRSEVLVTFMYEHMNRFWEHPEQNENFGALFGTTHWREFLGAEGSAVKRDLVIDLYRGQLQRAGFKYTYPFEMRNSRNAVVYFLIHGTKSLVGLDRMKKVMWKADPTGQFQFSDWADSRGGRQLSILGGTADPDDLERRLVERFGGEGWVDVNGAMLEFLLTQTRYHGNHYRRPVLGRMQREGRLRDANVRRPSGRNRNYWGEGTKVRFSSLGSGDRGGHLAPSLALE